MLEEAIEQMDSPSAYGQYQRFSQMEDAGPTSVLQADGPIEASSPQRMSGNVYSLVEADPVKDA